MKLGLVIVLAFGVSSALASTPHECGRLDTGDAETQLRNSVPETIKAKLVGLYAAAGVEIKPEQITLSREAYGCGYHYKYAEVADGKGTRFLFIPPDFLGCARGGYSYTSIETIESDSGYYQYDPLGRPTAAICTAVIGFQYWGNPGHELGNLYLRIQNAKSGQIVGDVTVPAAYVTGSIPVSP